MVCPVCQSIQLVFHFLSKDRMFQLPGIFRIYSCASCRVLSIQPKLKSTTLAIHYPTTEYYSYKPGVRKGFFSKLRAYSVRNQYSKSIPARLVKMFASVPALPEKHGEMRMLDVGCGSGETLIQLQELGWEGYGIDRDKQAIEAARKKGIKKVVLGTHKDLRSKFSADYFDAVRLYHVIEHIDNPREAVTSIAHILKPGGELIIGTPNAASLVASIFGSYWYNLDSPRHLVVFTPIALKKLLKDCGYTSINTSFASAGGIAGSLQYFLNEKINLKLDLVNKVWVILFLYPLEKLFDTLGVGDVFIIRARKRNVA